MRRGAGKALCETVLAELSIDDNLTATPVIRIPLSSADTPLFLKTETRTTNSKAVRACPPSVGRGLQHTNRYATAVTCGFPLPLVRERRSMAS